jgi:uncharacterized membrane protein YhaH (DUF805 family)
MIMRMPNFLESPVNTLSRYFDYQGTATRSEFWLFVLFTWISSFAVSILDAFFPGDLLGSIWNIFLLVPSVTCSIRRMHDVDRRGWFLLIPIYNFILSVTPSRPNRWQMGNPDEFNWTGKS